MNGVAMDSVYFNGSKMDKVYVNGTLVFEDMIAVSVPNGYGGSTGINLQTFLEQYAAGKNKITITNNGVLAKFISGNLGGLEVTFINNGEIQGRRSSAHGGDAMSISSAFTLINNGWIRAAGGRGGRGADGANDTYTTEGVEYHYSGTSNVNSWQAYCDSGAIRIFLDSKGTGSDYDCTRTGPYNSPSSAHPGKLYRGVLKWQSGQIYIYSVKRVFDKINTRRGGAGGEGGYGQGYGQGYTNGKVGAPSSPAGGNSGGTGGRGGGWGSNGYRGGNNGAAGSAAGKAIVGSGYLKTGSKTGKVNGAIA